jgi:DNA-binding CsgD family transcriptional regulator
MRLDEASKAISRLNRLLNTCPHAHFVRYAPALRLLRALRLVLGDDLEGAGHLLAALPPPCPNSVAATILRLAEWRSGECELLAPDTIDYLESPVGGNAIDRIYSLCLSAALAFERLQLTVSAALATEALELAHRRFGHLALVSCLPATLLAQVAYEQGRLEEAEALLRPRMTLIRAAGIPECVLRASVLLARAAVHRGRPGSALATLREAEALARVRGWRRVLSVASSECSRVLQAIRRCDEGVAEQRNGIRAADMADTRRDVGDHLLSPSPPRRFSSIESALRQICEAPASRRDLLFQCLRAGASHGLRMVFADAGPPIFAVLQSVYHGIQPSDPYLADLRPYISTLLKSRPEKTREDAVPASFRSLSRRESGVLQMIARGMSNKRIAQSLGIAPETVKTHAKGILSKLETRTRAQAVARAESIGLL